MKTLAFTLSAAMKWSLIPLVVVIACATLALPRSAAAQTTSGIPPAITTPDKVTILRLYSPLEPFFTKA